MKKICLSILFYAAALVSIVTIHRLSPTDIAGPGFDIVVYLLCGIAAIPLFAKSMMRIHSKENFARLYFVVNAIGTMMIVGSIYWVVTSHG